MQVIKNITLRYTGTILDDITDVLMTARKLETKRNIWKKYYSTF